MCGKKIGDDPDERTDIENWLLMEEEAALIQNEIIATLPVVDFRNII